MEIPGGDLSCTRWLRYLEGEGLGEIALQHLYRTVGFLSEVRADLERELFLRDRDLFSTPLDLMFLDVTSTYGCRDRETPWRKRGHSRDHRPDLLQVVVAVVVDRRGRPISREVFPGKRSPLSTGPLPQGEREPEGEGGPGRREASCDLRERGGGEQGPGGMNSVVP